MYFIYLICLLFAIICVLPVSTNKSINSGAGFTSPAIEARVYQGATNLLPPEDEGPPAQPIVPAEPETPSTSSWWGTLREWLPSTGTGLGSSSLLGAASHQPPSDPMGSVSIVKWLLGYSSDDKCDTKTKPDKGGSSKRSSDE